MACSITPVGTSGDFWSVPVVVVVTATRTFESDSLQSVVHRARRAALMAAIASGCWTIALVSSMTIKMSSSPMRVIFSISNGAYVGDVHAESRAMNAIDFIGYST